MCIMRHRSKLRVTLPGPTYTEHDQHTHTHNFSMCRFLIFKGEYANRDYTNTPILTQEKSPSSWLTY